jgi:hypothetical protein
MSNIVIDIAAQFTGKKAFSASEKAIDNLARSIKRAALGGGIATLMASSVKAFAADEKAAAMLGNTLKNLGLETFTASVEAMIDKTQLATGVLDEQLRPAFQKLVTSTGDAIQAQELLQLALDVSAGSGNDLVTVASDIANVMAGNNKGLKKYALGLSAVELKTMGATEVQLKFLEVYGGATEKASKTFAGSLGRIKAATEMARESLGKGLVDGLMVASGSQNIDELQKKILDFGKSAGNAFRTLGGLVRENLGLLKSLAITFAAIWTAGKVIAGITAVQKIIKALTASYKLLRATAVGTAIAQAAVLNPLGAIAYGATLVAVITGATISIDKLGDAFSDTDDKANKLLKTTKALGNFQMSTGTVLDLGAINRSVDAMYLKKAAAAKAKADKAAAAAKIKADNLAAANAAKLAKAQSIFDIDKIQIEAALKGKISDDERLRLTLQAAILNEDFELADKLQKKLEASQRATAALQGALNDIKPPKDPFAEWIASLALISANLSAILGMPVSGSSSMFNPYATTPGSSAGAGKQTPESIFQKDIPPTNKEEVKVIVTEPIPEPPATNNNNPFAGLGGSIGTTGFGFSLPDYLKNTIPQQPLTVIVNNNGTTLMQDEFVKAVGDAVIVANTNGTNNYRPGAVPQFE